VSHARILIICHANVARSVAAAHVLTTAFAEAGAAVDVTSAGTHATEGQHVSARTVTSLASVLAQPVTLSTHRAHQLTADDVEAADLIVAMEAAQVRAVRRTHPGAAEKAGTLGLLARELPEGGRTLDARVAAMSLAACTPDDADDVLDPAGGDDAVYVATMTDLVELCAQLARRICA